MGTVSWMGAGYPPDEGSVRRTDIKDQLIELGVLGKDGDKVSAAKTPESLQLITAGSTALSKVWSSLAGVGLGAGALIQGLKALNWLPGPEVDGGQQIALTISGALLASTAAIAIAIIVRGDVAGRATAAGAEYAARAAVTESLVRAFTYAPPAAVTVAAPPRHVVLTTGDKWYTVREFSWRNGKLAAVVSDTTIIPSDQIAWVGRLEPDSD